MLCKPQQETNRLTNEDGNVVFHSNIDGQGPRRAVGITEKDTLFECSVPGNNNFDIDVAWATIFEPRKDQVYLDTFDPSGIFLGSQRGLYYCSKFAWKS